MKKNIIISILTTIVVGFTILAIIGMNMEDEVVPTQASTVNVYRDIFIEGCTSEDAKYGYCSCVYDDAVDQYGETKALKMFTDLANAEEISDEVMKLITKCLPLNK